MNVTKQQGFLIEELSTDSFVDWRWSIIWACTPIHTCDEPGGEGQADGREEESFQQLKPQTFQDNI